MTLAKSRKDSVRAFPEQVLVVHSDRMIQTEHRTLLLFDGLSSSTISNTEGIVQQHTQLQMLNPHLDLRNHRKILSVRAQDWRVLIRSQ